MRHIRKDVFSVEDFCVLESCFSYCSFLLHTQDYFVTDFINPCILLLHAEDPSIRVQESRMWVPLFIEPSVPVMCI